MKISPIKNGCFAFKSGGKQILRLQNTDTAGNTVSDKTGSDKNPIKKSLEQLDTLKATIGAGIAAGVYALYYLSKEGFAVDTLFDTGVAIAKKNEYKTKNALKPVMYLGSIALVFAGFIGAIAAVYTAYNTPKALYKGKINAFKKEKEMDVYIKGNKVEKELYNQMNEAAKNADAAQKKHLALQYAKLKSAKNIVPDFVQLKASALSEKH